MFPNMFKSVTNSDESKRSLEMEAEHRRLEEQRKYYDEQFQKRILELDLQDQKELESVKKTIAELEKTIMAS